MRQVVEPCTRQGDCHRLFGGVLPIPAVNAREGRGERPGLAVSTALLVRLRVATRRAIRLRVELVVHWCGGLPGEQQRLALLEPVLIFNRSFRLEDELNLVLAERF